MKKLLNCISVLCCCLFFAGHIQAQCLFVDPSDTTNPSKALLESKNGWILPASGTIRILVVFAEVNYDTGTDPNPNSTPGWPVHSLPTWANQLFDPNVPTGIAQGLITRYFQLASSGKLNVIGDYLLAPSNGGIFSIPNSIGVSDNALSSVINSTMGGTFITGHNLNDVTLFDNYTLSSYGLPKITPSIDSPHKYDHVMYIWRNCQGENGCGWAIGNGYTFLGNGSDSHSHFLTYGEIPSNIARHEFSHLLYGGNNFHSGGGGWGSPENYWIGQESGWSNLGLYNCSFLSWNAWDRLRMDWSPTGNIYNPSARNSDNTSEVSGDLDASNPLQGGIYTLRDFVTSGDAIRIKLPFTNATTEYPEYIWIENHNTISMNSCAFDQFQFQTAACVEPAIYGLYMYMQIDKEVRQSTVYNDLYGGYADYLRPITAEGFFDRSFEATQVFNNCVQWGNTNAFTRDLPNPLTGGDDQDYIAVDVDNDNVLNHGDQYQNFTENLNGTYLSHLYNLGNSRHAFTISENKKLGIGTNPSSASMMNMVSYDNPVPTAGIKNLRKIYLNGVSVEILNQYSNGDIKVQVRFDDVDINNDVRWCGEEIILNPITTTSGYSLNLKSGHSITLDQGKTATRTNNPQIIAGKKVFSSPTLFRCISNAWFNQEQNSNVYVTNNSTLKLESGSKYVIENNSRLTIKSGCTLTMENCASLIINGNGKLIIEDGAIVNISNGAILDFENGQDNLNPGLYIVQSGSVDPIDIVPPYTTIGMANEIWSNKTYYVRNLNVLQNAKLTLQETKLIFTRPESKVIINQSGQLIADNSIFTSEKINTNCGQTMWQGIEVWGTSTQHQFTINGICNQGTCILTNGATIENAKEGITNWKPDDYNSIGGIIQATDANFINNWRAVSFMAYYNYNPNNPSQIVNDLSRFEHCNFKTTANLLNGDTFYTFVSMWKVKGIDFKGCLFENSNPNATTPSQLGSGIITADADFTVDGYCSDPYVSPCPEAEFTKTNFTHLNYGINAGKVETNNTYAVSNSIFTNCQVGIYNTGVNNSTITGNQFIYNSSYSPITQGNAINFNTGTGYTIEENAFSASTTGITTIGAWMQNTGGNANQIYRNTVSSYMYGFISAGQNRNSYGTVGLQFLCNNFSNGSYDIYSKVLTGITYNGCRKNQGEYISSTNIISAGNKFSSLALPYYNIRNTSNFLMNYYYGAGTNEYPAIVTTLVNRIAATTNNKCPCNNGGGENRAMTTLNDLESVYSAEKEQETIYRSQLASLIDGGNTDNMVNEVENSWPDETWQLRHELLSKSPYLSEDVLSKSSEKPSVLPNPILFEIFRANPEGFNNDAIIDNLGEKPNPMSEWMIDSLRNVRKKITYRTTIEGNIANHSTLKDRACFNIIKNVLSDTNGVDHTKLQTWLANMNSFNTEIMAVNDLCQTGNYSYAETILNDMPLKFNFTSDELAEYQTFVQLFGYLKNLYQNSRTIYQLDSAELHQIKLLADDGFGLGKIYSQNICRWYGFIYDPIFDLDDEMPSNRHSYSTESQNIENNNNESFLVYPSPATEWIVIKWNLLAGDNGAFVKFINPDSKIQSTIQLDALQGEQVIDVHDWPKGTYIYSVVESGKTMQTDKIVIN